jgi:hypothetical protein
VHRAFLQLRAFKLLKEMIAKFPFQGRYILGKGF